MIVEFFVVDLFEFLVNDGFELLLDWEFWLDDEFGFFFVFLLVLEI